MTSAAAVDVAVGVVLRADGAVLLGQRPAGKPYAGWWEFPGGKLEAGESVHDALVRELDEELGLRVRASCPWVVREFVYPHARVRLHFRRVFDVDGEPSSREGQAFTWRAPHAVDVAPLLPATVPVIGWLNLPRRCTRSAAARMGIEAFVRALEQRVRAGALDLLALHEPELSLVAFEALFHRVLGPCRAAGVRLAVSSVHAGSFARAAGGVMLEPEALRAARARPEAALVIARVQQPRDLALAAAIGADCVWVEPWEHASALPDAIAQTVLPAYIDQGWTRGETVALAAGAHALVHTDSFWERA